jgi:hypothetical protein
MCAPDADSRLAYKYKVSPKKLLDGMPQRAILVASLYFLLTFCIPTARKHIRREIVRVRKDTTLDMFRSSCTTTH